MKAKEFTLTEDHIKLLKNMYVTWDGGAYLGAPMIDPKRPYGNCDMLADIAKILGWKLTKIATGEEIMSKKQYEQANKLHRETETAMQIVLYNGVATAGTYIQDNYSNRWNLK